MTRGFLVLVSLFIASGCRCRPDVTPVSATSLRVSPTSILFADTFVRFSSRARVDVANDGAAGTVTVSVSAPFTASLEQLELGTGEAATVTIDFAPTAAGPVDGVLHIGALEVSLHGTGLSVPECVADDACSTSTFDAVLATCVRGSKPDGANCEAGCVSGVCTNGTCVGSARDCDDGDACTVDVCAANSASCSHSPLTCAPPSDPCQQARCDSKVGCATEAALDGTLCGADDCVSKTVDVCIAGTCVTKTRPNTARCANRWVALAIPPRGSPAVAYDSTRQQLVVFGGSTWPSFFDDTWEWGGTNWLERVPSNSPPARADATIAYDSTRRRTVLFGGHTSLSELAHDTWEWDGTTWLLRADLLVNPPASEGASMAYDPARQRLVLFGDGTWEFDGTRWQRREPALSPSKRWSSSLTYDASRGRVVLVGGSDGATNFTDTWEWNGVTWRLLSAGFESTAVGQSVAYDAARGRLVMFRGLSSTHEAISETWEFDGTAWQRHAAANQLGGAAQLVFDSRRQRVVAFGGMNPSSYEPLPDLWEWDGASWTRTSPLSPRAIARTSSLTYDSDQQRVLSVSDGETWSWNGSEWTIIDETYRGPANVTYDRDRHQALLTDSQSHLLTWEDGGWQLKNGIIAPGSLYGGLVYDVERARGVSVSTSITQEWNGVSWSWLNSVGTPNLGYSTKLVYDAARREVLVTGGSAGRTDTWTWNGTTWTNRMPATSSPGGVEGCIGYDPVRQLVVLVSNDADTWEWDGTNWSKRETVNSPQFARSCAMTYDEARGQLLLVGRLGTWFFVP